MLQALTAGNLALLAPPALGAAEVPCILPWPL